MAKASRLLTAVLAIILLTAGCETVEKESGNVRPAQKGVSYIDGHNHLFGGRQGRAFAGAARSALKKMDELGISRMVIMPPPQVPSQPGLFDVNELMPVVEKYPERFVCLGGGGTLNVMIHRYKDHQEISPEVASRFRKQAMNILSGGAVGFGEFSVVHFSLNHDHPYEEVRPDHPLFFLLADIAGEQGVPVDIHMEAVPRDMDLPDRKPLTRSGRNPSKLRENIRGFERLLAHNRKAKIIWAHVGWCNTGERTPALCRGLLQKHPNLYMSFKLSPESARETRPLLPDQRGLKPEWLALIRDFPDRFFIGTDQFYSGPGGRRIGPQKTEATRVFMNLLPPELAYRVGVENPRRLFF